LAFCSPHEVRRIKKERNRSTERIAELFFISFTPLKEAVLSR
jgi:hypothetical protein